MDNPVGRRQVLAGAGAAFFLSALEGCGTEILRGMREAPQARLQLPPLYAATDRITRKTLINATGYGARALFGDQSVTPVRGQLTHTIPQPDIHYGLSYKGVWFVPRRDGLVFQVAGENAYYGFDDATTVPDRAEAELAVNTIAGLYA